MDSAGFTTVRRFLIMMLLLGACAGIDGSVDGSTAAPVAATAAERDQIHVPLSLYVVLDRDDPASALSSRRSTDDVNEIAAAVNRIWGEAGIVFDPVNVQVIEIPPDVLQGIATSLDATAFFQSVGDTFDVPEPGVVNGFFVRTAGGVNGFAPTGSRVFFVVDEPTVHDERVSSHELGHVFGLRHAPEDSGRLMYSGTNGMELGPEEQVVARYGADGLLR